MSANFNSQLKCSKLGLVKANSILKSTCDEFIVSKQKLNQADGISLVKLNREQKTQNLCFASRPFMLCGLPVRALPPGELMYERRNGHFVLQITGHPKFGVPFGQDRIVPIFLATLAVRQQSRVVRFRSAAEMLETFGIQKGGKQYRRLVSAFERIFGATIFFGTDERRSSARVVNLARFNFLSEAQIWYNRADSGETMPAECENVIVLSEDFYREVIGHPIPTDLEAVKVLVAAPAVLDLFMWLSYRCFTAQGEERIPIFGSGGLVAQLGCVEYSRPRRFRAKLEQWFDVIRTLWPGCPARISKDGLTLLVRHATAVIQSEEPPNV